MAKRRTAIDAASTRPDINYPLVEAKRPQIYRAMKYWGKKPHNRVCSNVTGYCY